uniref:F-box domain-containing protein n=1 Tax=Ascaris lumbricoides TaxID=6252 RepID=A0A9J2PXP4_ASCLU
MYGAHCDAAGIPESDSGLQDGLDPVGGDGSSSVGFIQQNCYHDKILLLKVNGTVESTKITDYFVVRKRRSISSDEESDMDTSKKRVKNEVHAGNDQVVPEAEQSENLQSQMSRWCRFAILKKLPENPLGIFATLSPDIFLTIIDRIPVARLATLAETSLEMNSLLRCYATSGTAGKRFIKETAVIGVPLNVQMTNEDPFYAWGMLLKSVTITDSASKRIDYFSVFYARFLTQWDFCECARLLHSLFKTTESGLYRAILETLDEPDGLHPDKEMKIRRRLKNLFLSHQYPDIRDASFWLSAILRMHLNTTKQAKLLYILFGPTRLNDFLEEVIDWHDLCEIPVSTLVTSKQKLGPLSDALLTLMQTRCLGSSEFVYNEADMFNLLEELTTYPQPWPFENFVALLLNRTALIPIALAFRMMHGYGEEAGQMFNAMRSRVFKMFTLWSKKKLDRTGTFEVIQNLADVVSFCALHAVTVSWLSGYNFDHFPINQCSIVSLAFTGGEMSGASNAPDNDYARAFSACRTNALDLDGSVRRGSGTPRRVARPTAGVLGRIASYSCHQPSSAAAGNDVINWPTLTLQLCTSEPPVVSSSDSTCAFYGFCDPINNDFRVCKLWS